MSGRIINPAKLGRPRGYSNGVLFEGGSLLFVAGQIGWTDEQRLVDGGFVHQFEQALRNVLTVVDEAGGGPANIGRLTIYVTNKADYLSALEEVGEAYRRVLGRHYPAMALVEIISLVEPGALVEIEATAVIAS